MDLRRAKKSSPRPLRFLRRIGVAKGTCGALSARGRRSIRVQSAPWHPPDGYEQATATRLDKICVQQLCKPAVSSTGVPGWLRTRPNCSSSEDSEAATVVIVSRERGRVLPRCRLAKMWPGSAAIGDWQKTSKLPSTPHAPSSMRLPSCSSCGGSRVLHDFRNRL